MQDLIAFELADGYEDFSGGNVSLVGGEFFDVGKALEDGDGRIVLGPGARQNSEEKVPENEALRANSDSAIVDALVKYPGLKRVEPRSGDEPPSYADVDLTAPAEATVAELKERAKTLGVKGFSALNKEELVAAVDAAEKAEAQEGRAGDVADPTEEDDG